MLEPRLEDFTLEALRSQADSFGVASQGLDRPALITAIREKQREQNHSVRRAAAPKSQLSPSLIISIVATCIAVYAAFQNQKQAAEAKRQSDVAIASLTEEIKRNTASTKRQEIDTWQSWVVFTIIDERNTDHVDGLTYDEIRSAYIREATAVKDVELPREELSKTKLDRILMDLRRTQMIYKTHEDKYVTQRSEINIAFGRGVVMDRAKIAIVSMLSGKEKGKYTQQTLQPDICQQFGLSPQEFYIVLTEMFAEGALVMDSDRIYCVFSPPNVNNTPENSKPENTNKLSEEPSGEN